MPGQVPVAGTGWGARWGGRGLAGLFMLPGVYAVWVAVTRLRLEPDPGTWLLPLCTGLCCVALGGGILLAGGGEPGEGAVVRHRAVAIGLLVLYAFVLLPYLGFLVGSLLLVVAVGLIFAKSRRFVLIGGVALAVGMWVLFAYALLQPLPTGWGS